MASPKAEKLRLLAKPYVAGDQGAEGFDLKGARAASRRRMMREHLQDLGYFDGEGPAHDAETRHCEISAFRTGMGGQCAPEDTPEGTLWPGPTALLLPWRRFGPASRHKRLKKYDQPWMDLETRLVARAPVQGPRGDAHQQTRHKERLGLIARHLRGARNSESVPRGNVDDDELPTCRRQP